jgi:KUP system potassium uptake protein
MLPSNLKCRISPKSDNSGNGRKINPAALLTALGIVYGDIGTSPLYVYQAIKKATGQISETAALGSLSLVFWTLTIIVAVKYCIFVMRADNRGEGGILALMSLTHASWRGHRRYLLLVGLAGAALLYGDGIITPAISVLSAVEGLNVASHAFAKYTVAITTTILLMLFLVQRFGTATVGNAFGPLMAIWFVTIATLGVGGIVEQPHVLAAINPAYAVTFLAQQNVASLAILGAVFLCVTGAEAMYADMGHMGREAICVAWMALVLPALLLNYAGQTAVLLRDSYDGANPFFQLVPPWGLYPLVGLSTAATIIASQAIITGTFSLTRQAMQLGWLPGVNIVQTSSRAYGQIYVPVVNWMMMLATLALTIQFGSSDALAGAYGTAVSTTMLLTTILLYRVMRVTWRCSASTSLVVFLSFIGFDLAFFCANLLKIIEGGWVPLSIGMLILIVMVTWRDGIDALHRTQDRDTVAISHFVRQLREKKIKRVLGKAIFLTRLQGTIPPLIADHLRQMGALYQNIVALTVRFAERPRIERDRRITFRHLGPGFWHFTVTFGFIEIPNVPNALHTAKAQCPVDLDDAVYFSELDHVTRRKTRPRMAAWRRILFSFLYRNAVHQGDRFGLPPQNFVQIGRQREI